MVELVYRFDEGGGGPRLLPQTAEEAARLLDQGNAEFAQVTEACRQGDKRRIIVRGSGMGARAPLDGEPPAQEPFAAVLACSDARVPTEIVFNRACNELFVVRVAGNVLGQECLGSLRYAAGHFPLTLKLLVVLGHGGCGAVTTAVAGYLNPDRSMETTTDPAIRAIVDKLMLPVRAAASSLEDCYGSKIARKAGYRAALLETAVVLNAAWTACRILRNLRGAPPRLGVVFGVYDLVSRRVRLPLSPPQEFETDELGLFQPPRSAEEFRALGARICGGRLVSGLFASTWKAA